MNIALGIDTGGTYTDAALIGQESGKVLAGAKSLTTRHDPSLGISVLTVSFVAGAVLILTGVFFTRPGLVTTSKAKGNKP